MKLKVFSLLSCEKSKKREMMGLLFVLIILLIFPFVFSFYTNYLLIQFFAYALILLGFNLLFGYTGLLSFGHALFVGLGAYTVAFFVSRFGIEYMEIAILAAIIFSIILGAGIGCLCVRYTKIHFAMLTLAFGMLMYSFLLKFYYITGGDEGIVVYRPKLLGMTFKYLTQTEFINHIYYYYVLIIAAIGTLLMWRIINSPFGLTIQAIRDNPEKAEYLGIDVKRYRLYSFIISGIYASVGGALLAPVIGHVDPALTFWTHSGDIVFMALLGGFNSFVGPIVGALVWIFLKDILSSWTLYWRIILGAVLAIIVIAAPEGLVGWIKSIYVKLIKKESEKPWK